MNHKIYRNDRNTSKQSPKPRKAYLFKTDLQLIEMFTPFINEKLAKRLFFNLKKAIVRVKNAEGYEDTRRYNNPIRIGRNPKNFVDEKN